MLGLFHLEKDVWEDVPAFQSEAGTGCALSSHAVAGVTLSTECCGPASCAGQWAPDSLLEALTCAFSMQVPLCARERSAQQRVPQTPLP